MVAHHFSIALKRAASGALVRAGRCGNHSPHSHQSLDGSGPTRHGGGRGIRRLSDSSTLGRSDGGYVPVPSGLSVGLPVRLTDGAYVIEPSGLSVGRCVGLPLGSAVRATPYGAGALEWRGAPHTPQLRAHRCRMYDRSVGDSHSPLWAQSSQYALVSTHAPVGATVGAAVLRDLVGAVVVGPGDGGRVGNAVGIAVGVAVGTTEVGCNGGAVRISNRWCS